MVDEAKKAKEEGKEKVILFNWSGHGLIDLGSYDKYFSGELQQYTFSQEEQDKYTSILANYPKPQHIKSR